MDILLAFLVLSLIFFFFYTSLLINTLKYYRKQLFSIWIHLNAYPRDDPEKLISDIESILDRTNY